MLDSTWFIICRESCDVGGRPNAWESQAWRHRVN